MASSGSFNTNTYIAGDGVGNPYLQFSWNVKYTDIANNKHTIHWKLTAYGINEYMYIYLHLLKLGINGSSVLDYDDIGMQVYNGTVVSEGDFDITHNADGSKSFSAEIHAGFYSFNQENVSGSSSWALDKIDRYAALSISENSKDINSIILDWEADAIISGVKYSINDGATYSEYISVASKTGNVQIKELSPNTSYKIKLKVKRKDNSLETESRTLIITTFDYAKFSNIDTFEFGNSININKTNPSQLSNNLEVYVNDSLIASRNNISNSYVLSLIQSELDILYKKYSTTSSVINCVYKLITICNSIKYEDSFNSNIVLTGNAKTCKIKNNSSIKRAQVYIKNNGQVKKAVLFTKVNGIVKRCI